LRDEIPIVISGQRQDGPHITQIASRGVGRSLAVKMTSLPRNKEVQWHPTQGWMKRIRSLSTDKRPATELAKDFDSWTRRTENEDRFVDFLKRVEPRLQRLRPFEIEGRRVLYADVGLPERIPLPFLGEGFNRLVQIYGAIIGEEADVLLVDEIENGLHWSALPQIWTGIREAVTKEEVQIFATTHSLECIAAAAEAFKGEPKNDLAVHRLERMENGDIHCVTMNEDELERMLERDWEVR
ncbi:MAG: AAA family ATPase, partial [Prosthecobacter sp.]|nr:AAA family ATPase [Prosthecobacter sp.]